MLDALGLPRSTYYYYHLSRPRRDRWSDVLPLIEEAFRRTPNGMGYRQVAMVLRWEHGISMSGKTVLMLMRRLGLRCRIRRKRYVSFSKDEADAAPNVLARSFGAERPMQKLVTDVTEFKVGDGKAYLSPVMDLFNNEIVSWSVSRHPSMDMIGVMLDGLQARMRGDRPLLHSDQGWQYQQRSYRARLKSMGVTQSMSRRANCLDNACMEGFFGHLKDELTRGRRLGRYDNFRRELDAYIRYWNERRRQCVLGGMTPVQRRLSLEEAFDCP